MKNVYEWPYANEFGVRETVESDLVVLGGGLAGCFAAIAAARKGAKVALVEKGATERSGSAGSGFDHWESACSNPCSKVTPKEIAEAYIEEQDEYSNGIAHYIECREGYYYIVLAVVVALIAFTMWLDKSRFGYALRTISGNENAAESVGIHTARTKAEAFALSAMVTSLAGGLYVQYIQYVDPYTSSTLSVSLMICLVTVMGGCGTVFGPVVGATVLTYISQNTRVWFGGTGTGVDLIIYGALVILVVLFLPKGVLSIPGILKKRFSKKEASVA